MKLIVGLGNPGKKYEKTRHNVGFLTINNLQLTISNFSDWKFDKKLNAEISKGEIGGEKIILAKPQTFMNNSGQTAAAATHFYKIKPRDILVIHDDIDLPLGKIRIKPSGSSAGHKGVQSIIDALKTENFIHLRIGINPKIRPKNFKAEKFVLQKFTKEEEKIISEAIKKTVEAIFIILNERVEAAMNRFN